MSLAPCNIMMLFAVVNWCPFKRTEILEAIGNQIRQVCMNCRSQGRQNSVLKIMKEGVVMQ